MKKKILCLLLVFCLIFSIIPVSADVAEEGITVLFTHDLHSRFLPIVDSDGTSYGGYARLATLINAQRERYPNALLVDGGDFSMGSLFQTAYITDALELRLMGMMGYDATTLGNHELDYLRNGLAAMLDAAVDSGETLPAVVSGNFLPPEDDAVLKEAFRRYGIEPYTLIERGGVYFAVMGVFGYDAEDCAPAAKMQMLNPIETAKQTVADAIDECKSLYGVEPFIIALSHSGTDGNGGGEDVELANACPEIDLIISAHTHTTLKTELTVGSTVIVSAGSYGRYLGAVHFSADGKELKGYELIPVDDTVTPDPETATRIEEFKHTVESSYLDDYGFTFDHVLMNNTVPFEDKDELSATQHDSTLGSLFADAYKTAAEKALGTEIDVALTAVGIMRASLPLGDITVSDIFNAASLGVGTEGELICVYITGTDLLAAMEVDASIQPIMSVAQLFFSGVEYSYNTNRMIFNKVDSSALVRNDGTREQIEPDKLYRVATGMYVGQMLATVKERSFGLISITPRDKDGNPIALEDLENYVVRTADGAPVKEWYAIASYLEDMDGTMDSRYASPDGRKHVYASFNPIDLLKAPNLFTLAAVVIVLGVATGIFFAVRGIIIKVKKK